MPTKQLHEAIARGTEKTKLRVTRGHVVSKVYGLDFF